MGISHYLAMTAEEISTAEVLPQWLSYMACHFSPYGTGLTGRPKVLPPNAMLILNDRIPYCGHDQSWIAEQLEQWAQQLQCSCVLLDFQRDDTPKDLGVFLAQTISCPTAVAADFATGTDCSVFLPPVPPDVSPEKYLKPWTGREIWLETTPEVLQITVDSNGTRKVSLPLHEFTPLSFEDKALCCHYRTEVFPDQAVFTLQRTKEDLMHLLEEAASLGVTKAVSLYQQIITTSELVVCSDPRRVNSC